MAVEGLDIIIQLPRNKTTVLAEFSRLAGSISGRLLRFIWLRTDCTGKHQAANATRSTNPIHSGDAAQIILQILIVILCLDEPRTSS
jgi:hypothetical protein